MQTTPLGEFEEIVLLAVAILDGRAYGFGLVEEIRTRTGRQANLGAVQVVLKRLEEKGLADSVFGEATRVRGGKRKRYYSVTPAGKQALAQARDQRLAFWKEIPDLQTTGL